MIRVRGLTKSFGDRLVLRGVDLDVSKGECVALVGPNGAGKTTLLRILATLAKPNAGSVRLHESVGFRPVGTFRSVGFKQGRWHDVIWWFLVLAPHEDEPTDVMHTGVAPTVSIAITIAALRRGKAPVIPTPTKSPSPTRASFRSSTKTAARFGSSARSFEL